MRDGESMDIFGKLRLCFNLLRRSGERRQCHGGFRGRGRVLAFLREHDGIGQRDLAESLGIRAPSASELIGRLADDELIERRVNDADRRSINVFLTEKGAKLAEWAGRNRQQEARELLDDFSDEEREQFAHLLEKLALSLKKRTAFSGREDEGGHGHGDGCGCGGHGGGAHGCCQAHPASGGDGRGAAEEGGHHHGCGCGGMRRKRRDGRES